MENNKDLRNDGVFDPTKCFMMFGSWMDAGRDIYEACGAEAFAKMMFIIDDFCRFGIEPKDEDFHKTELALKVLWKAVKERAESSIANRRRGFAENGLTAKQKTIVEMAAKNPLITAAEIHKQTGISEKHIRETRRKFRSDIAKKQKELADGRTIDNWARSIPARKDEYDGIRVQMTDEESENLLKDYSEEMLPF